jgi:hypothetical protein
MYDDAACARPGDEWWAALSRYPLVPDWSRYPTLAAGHRGAVRPNVPKTTCFPAKNTAGLVVVTVFLVMTVVLVVTGTVPAEAVAILAVAGSAAVTLVYRLLGHRGGGAGEATLPA